MVIKFERILFSAKKFFKRLKKLMMKKKRTNNNTTVAFVKRLAIDSLTHDIIQKEAFYIIKL